MNAQTIGKLADRFMPPALARVLHRYKDVMELNAVRRCSFDTTRLRPINELSLRQIFKSDATERAWRESRNEIGKLRIPDGTGGVNPGDRRAIFYLVHGIKPRSVLEIGTHIGASTVHIAAALHHGRVKEGKEAKLTTVDFIDVNCPRNKPWLRNGAQHSPREMIEQLGFSSFVNFVAQKSLDFAADCDEKFDFIFLDGNHAAETVYREISVALNMLKPNGVILLHDYFPDLKPLWSNGAVVTGPFLGTERMRKEGADAFVLPLGRLPWPTKLNSSFTSLALLTRSG